MSAVEQSRYPGVQPYRQDQKHLFFGREEDTFRLLSNVTGEKLSVLFGKSGYGKSSLIHAGLFPALLSLDKKKDNRNYIPISVRFNAYEDKSGNENLFDKYYFHKNKVVEDLQIPKKDDLSVLPDSLWGNWKALDLPERSIVVLVFDQFEEFFTYPLEQRDIFKRQLAELLYSKYPPFLDEHEDELSDHEYEHLSHPLEVRAVFAIRSDKLALLNSLQDHLPAALYEWIELGPLSLEQAQNAIIGPAMLGSTPEEELQLQEQQISFRSPPFEYQEQTVLQILQSIEQRGVVPGVEAFVLQILCNEIENRVIAGQIKDIDGNGFPDVQPQNIPDLDKLSTIYYERRLQVFNAKQGSLMQRVIEDSLIHLTEAEEGRRLSVDGGVLLSRYGEQGLSEDLLDQLVDTFLLRREPNSLGRFNYELSHDLLLAPVVVARRERLAKEAEIQKNEEIAAEKERRRRANTITAVVSVLAALSIAGGILAYLQSQKAKKLQIEANQAKDEALIQADSARAAQNRATIALDLALQRESEAVILQLEDPLKSIQQLQQRGYGRSVYSNQINTIQALIDKYEENPYLKEAFDEAREVIKE